MSCPIEIILDPKRQLLRFYCGQCGDPKDITIDVDKNSQIHVYISDSFEDTDFPKEMQLTPIEIIT